MPAPRSKQPTSAPASTPPRRRRQTNQWFIIGAVLACFAAVLLFAGWDVLIGRDQPAVKRSHGMTASTKPHGRAPSTPRNEQQSLIQSASSDEARLIDDDGQTLWASPTAGKPLDLAYLPPGVQIIIALRPEALASHPEGEKVFSVLGPVGERAISFIDDLLATPRGITQLVSGCRVDQDGRWQATFVAHLSSTTAAEHVAEKLPDAAERNHGGTKYWFAGEWAYWIPSAAESDMLVVTPADSIAELIELDGNPPPLRRDFERLLAHTDADRHVTLMVAPNFLFSEGQNMFSGPMARLRAPLFWFLGDELSAAALSLHWDDNFFAEFIATPTLDTSPQRAAQILAERVAQMPDKLEDYVVNLETHPYGRRILVRFPGMVRKLAAYTRSDFQTDHVTLRAYLPAVAGHNLLMGAELTLMEQPGSKSSTAEAPPVARPAEPANSTAEDALGRVTSLAFARDTLEAALEQLSQDIGVEIVIVGRDLQADGITKNQSFGINIQDKPAGEILVEILRLANPDKTATGPNDERQKLIYVIAPPKKGKPPQILVTTRAAVEERGDTLPSVFVAKRQ